MIGNTRMFQMLQRLQGLSGNSVVKNKRDDNDGSLAIFGGFVLVHELVIPFLL
jgi:hypothetical protein